MIIDDIEFGVRAALTWIVHHQCNEWPRWSVSVSISCVQISSPIDHDRTQFTRQPAIM